MTAETIERLCMHLAGYRPRPTKESTALYRRHRHNPAFGWFFASEVVRRGLEFPRFLEGDDHWLWEAYLHAKDHTHCQEIELAADIHERGGGEVEQAVLKGLLLCRDATVESVAETLNYPERVVGAYERLFFNVLDRQDDGVYLAGIAYPNGRIVENFDEHPRNSYLADLIVRSGYNNGPEDVLHFAGFQSDLLSELGNSNALGKLEELTIANGRLLLRNGWLGQKRDGMALSRAYSLLVAKAKQNDLPQVGTPFNLNVGESLLAELTKVKRKEADARLENSCP